LQNFTNADVHVAVHTADHGRVELAVDEPLGGGIDCRQCGGTGRIGGEAWPAEVEQVRDPTRQDVRELARHRVFVDFGELAQERARGLIGDQLAGVLRQPGERR